MQPQADVEAARPADSGNGLAVRLAAILWPSFLSACALQMLVFGWVDPGELHSTALGLGDWPPQALQSLAFLAFWTLTSIGSTLTVALLRAPRA